MDLLPSPEVVIHWYRETFGVEPVGVNGMSDEAVAYEAFVVSAMMADQHN